MNDIISLYFAVSKECNLRCSYCYLSENNRSSKIDDDKIIQSTSDFLKKCKKENIDIFNVGLHGAEPTMLQPDSLVKIAKQFHTVIKGSITVQSNGTRLNKSYIEAMITEDENCVNYLNIGISFDGHKTLHNKYRGNTYDTIVQNIDLLQKYGFKTQILSVITNDTIKELVQYKEFMDTIVAKNLSYEFKIVEHDHSMTLENRLEFSKWIRDHNFTKGMQPLKNNICINKGNECNFFEFDVDGSVYSCNKVFDDRYSFANWKDEKLQDILLKRKDVYKYEKTSEQCITCEYKHLCNSGCPISRIDGLPEDCVIRKDLYNHGITPSLVTTTLIGSTGCGCGGCGAGDGSAGDSGDSSGDGGESENDYGVDETITDYSDYNKAVAQEAVDQAFADEISFDRITDPGTLDKNHVGVGDALADGGHDYNGVDPDSYTETSVVTSFYEDTFFGFDYSYTEHTYSDTGISLGMMAEAYADIADVIGMDISIGVAKGFDTLGSLAMMASSLQVLELGMMMTAMSLSKTVTALGVVTSTAGVLGITESLQELNALFGGYTTSVSMSEASGGGVTHRLVNEVLQESEAQIAENNIYYNDIATGGIFDKLAGGRLYQGVFAGGIYYDATVSVNTNFSVGKPFNMSKHSIRTNAPYSQFLPKNQAGTNTFTVV